MAGKRDFNPFSICLFKIRFVFLVFLLGVFWSDRLAILFKSKLTLYQNSVKELPKFKNNFQKLNNNKIFLLKNQRWFRLYI